MSDQSPVTTIGATELVPKSRFQWDTRTFLATWMSVSMFGLIVMCWWKTPDPTNQIFNSLISIYGATGFVTVIQWWMGSSKGSDDKNQTIQNAVNK